MKIPQSFTLVRCWLLIGQCTLFTLKMIGKIPSSCASCSLIGRRHDNKHYVTHIQVRGIPKYCSHDKSLSEIMLRNGFKNFDDRRITKPKQSLISVLISNWLIFINRKIIRHLPSILSSRKKKSAFNKMCCGNLLCIMTSISWRRT